MKRGLSVLLIAASLFGLYGGAINLNDVLECKKYWEEAGAQSTADMNKLEDGLNQLKDNEQAYLEGVEQLEDGEQAIIEGQNTLEEGRETLEKGEADYAAAPAQLKKGKKTLYDLTRLINGLTRAKKSFNEYSINAAGRKGPSWSYGFEARAARADYSDAGLQQARQVIAVTLNTEESKQSVALIENLAGLTGLIDNVNNAKTYAAFDKAIVNMAGAFGEAADELAVLKIVAETYAAETNATKALKEGLRDNTEVVTEGENKEISKMTLAQTEKALEKAKADVRDAKIGKEELEKQKAVWEIIPESERSTAVIDSDGTTADKAIEQAKKEIEKYEKGIEAGKAQADSLQGLIAGRKQTSELISVIRVKAGKKLALAGALDPRLASLTDAVNDLADADMPNDTFADTYEGLQKGLTVLAGVLGEKILRIKTSKATFEAWDSGYKQLKDGQNQLADQYEGIPYAFSQIKSNPTLRKAVKKNAPVAYAKLSKYTGSRLAADDMDAFDADMKEVIGMIDKILPVLKKLKADGVKTYNAGLASYKSAPARLAAGRAQLAEGKKALAEGRAQIADGRVPLAEYEDGERQIRDGLADLMSAEAEGGLASILDRRGGDGDFDNGDEHLDIAEGLEAVEAGREYQADSGEMIAKEIKGRAVGTAVGIGAGALGILAAILSFLKRNRSAGICALLSAVAGGAGVAIGTSAGSEFSDIAGSLAGSIPWVAFGVLGGIALIQAVINLANRST